MFEANLNYFYKITCYLLKKVELFFKKVYICKNQIKKSLFNILFLIFMLNIDKKGHKPAKSRL